ncbi:Phosphoesterase domain-containing protein [Cinnamomum micranthum f. kanehirae]|uniref:Purple acid phosphatase n=1 Tax=Cinnamomum micranthum f. kanehirae TaxID=337451 RepID=A0A3S3M4B1_9MAGN|nr:Phosphoesterase domain-containing protein [Cinnamomum micranthum f. kanehirae]
MRFSYNHTISVFSLFSIFFFLRLTISSSISIQITPKTLTKSGDSVQIQWSGLDSPSHLDWLGIYSPPNSPDSDYIGYIFLSSCHTWQSGSCNLTLPLADLRSNYAFRIFRWSNSPRLDKHHNPLPGTEHRLAVSEELRFEVTGPQQIHLSFTSREDEIRVLFVTADNGSERFVNYGLEVRRLEERARAEVRRYEQWDMCDAPAKSLGWRDPGFIYDGVMRNLKKGRRYFYRVGSDTSGWSAIHSFMSRDGDSDETIAFLFGDLGTSVPYTTFVHTQDESKSTVKWILRDIEALGNKPAFVSHIGDISYARGYSWLWDSFFTQIEPIASKVPYHVCIGNHEYDWPLQPWKPDWASNLYGKDGGGECGVPYSFRFNMPGNSSFATGTSSPATQNLYYSFDAGVVHFVYMSTETDFLTGSDQYNFIQHDLENVDRAKTPFIVFQGHRPMYTTSTKSRDAPLRDKMLEHLEPLLVKNEVDLALWGHVHSYERFCPLINYTCGHMNETGLRLPVHVVIGMAGHDAQPSWEPRPDHPKDPVYPQPDRSMYRGFEFGYTRLVATRKKLTLSYVGNHDGETHDILEIPSPLGHDMRSASNPEFAFSWYVKLGSVLLIGAFVGYVLGFLSHSRREAASRSSWTPMRTEEIEVINLSR